MGRSGAGLHLQAAFSGYTPHTHLSYPYGCSQVVPHLSLCAYCAPSTHRLGDVGTFNNRFSHRQSKQDTSSRYSQPDAPKVGGERLDLLLFWRICATCVLCPLVCLQSRVSVRLTGVGGWCLSVCRFASLCAHPSAPPTPGHYTIQGTSAFPPCPPRPHLCSAGPIHHLCPRA